MDEKYYGFVYETVNLLNNKKYIGKCVFKRANGWKDYLGSGTYIKRAIKKYGKENFRRDIIFLAMNKELLEEIEEFVIEFHKAPNNDDYYNLKYTSIGGDTISSHPNREKRIKQMSELASGKNNPMYGKKNDKTINSIKKANSKAIVVDGVEYKSSRDYSRMSGLKPSTVRYRLSSASFPNYKYKYEQEKVERKAIARKSIEIDEVVYKSIYQASKDIGLSRTTIRDRLNSDEYKNYKYINS